MLRHPTVGRVQRCAPAECLQFVHLTNGIHGNVGSFGENNVHSMVAFAEELFELVIGRIHIRLKHQLQ